MLHTSPVGLVDAIAPHQLNRFSGVALAGAAAVGVTILLLIVAVLAVRSARHGDAAATRTRNAGIVGTLATRAGSPVVVDGLQAAFVPRSATPVLAGGALLSGAFVAAVVFGTSLSALVSTPRSFGWPWDVAAMTGAGYGDLELDLDAALAFDDDPEVQGWMALGFLNDVSLDGEPMMSMIGLDRTSHVELPVLAGALPTQGDEIAIGASTAAERHLVVGDTVQIGGALGPTTATITGIVVFPTLGPLFAERVGTGTGLLLPEAMFDPEQIAGLATFVGIDLRDDASPATVARVAEQLSRLDRLGAAPSQYSSPVRPPEIIDAGATRTAPLSVGLVFAVLAVIGLVFASWASARSRRRDLAVLRALGFSGSQVRRSVRVQSVATMLGALLIGVPIGVIVGRVVWRAFANQLGVVPEPASPWTPVLVAVAGGIVLAVLAAEIPARLASRPTPAEGLRAE